jgi:hypothetical protein
MRSENFSSDDFGRTNWLIVLVVLAGVAVALLPVIFQWSAPPNPRMGASFTYLPAILVAILCYALDPASNRKEKVDTLLLCLVLAFLTTYLHIWLVDLGQYFEGHPNLEWQLLTHKAVLELNPRMPPDSYRFLPNSLVRLFEQVTGDFVSARDGYRNLFEVLLFYSLYRLARLYLGHGGSLFCLPLLAVIFPPSFRFYAGQVTDPLSHLSFILAFIFIETEQFVYLVLTVAIGCLAKETIVAMAGYYLLFRWRDKLYLWKSVFLILASMGVYAIARISVLHGLPAYEQISGVGSEQVSQNWNDYARWVPGLLYTLGVFVPFVIAGWQKSPWNLRSLAIYWFPVLFLSGLFFSWLREVRNFVPVAAILVILTVYHLLPGEREESIGKADMLSSGAKSRGLPRPGSKKLKAR